MSSAGRPGSSEEVPFHSAGPPSGQEVPVDSALLHLYRRPSFSSGPRGSFEVFLQKEVMAPEDLDRFALPKIQY